MMAALHKRTTCSNPHSPQVLPKQTRDRNVCIDAGTEAPHLPLDGSLPNSLVRLMLYGKPACNLIGLAFDSGPLDRLIVVAAPKRRCVAPKRDDDITFGNAVVAPYTNFGRMVGNHEFAANRLRWSQPNQSC
jgi:hypothetical protein